jgi:hypothetical protein
VVFVYFGAPAPPLVGVAPENACGIYDFLEFLWKVSRTLRTMMNNVPGTMVLISVLIEFSYVFVGDLVPVFRFDL